MAAVVRRVLTLALVLAAASLAAGCADKNSVLRSLGPVKVVSQDQDWIANAYKTVKTLTFNQPTPNDRKFLIVNPDVRTVQEKPNKKQFACLSGWWGHDQCNRENYMSGQPGVFAECYPANNGSSRGAFTRTDLSGVDNTGGSCQDAIAWVQTWMINKTSGDTLRLTFIETRELARCVGGPKRYIRTETADYRVVSGCLVSARPAGGCVKGLATCQPCKPAEVPVRVANVWHAENELICVKKQQTCSLANPQFTQCPAGSEAIRPSELTVAGQKVPAIVCSQCPPHTFNQYMDRRSLSSNLFADKCQPCPDWKEAPYWGAEYCRGCKPGQYPAKKRAPIECTPCPPGTYAPYGELKECKKCPGNFAQPKPGQTECKRCPTNWRCLLPASALGKFGDTLFRWHPSDNPACLSQDGKTCWKGEGSCAQKLTQVPALIKAGKLKELVCGAMHKKVWGITGYEDPSHWCNLTKRLFMRPGKDGAGTVTCPPPQ